MLSPALRLLAVTALAVPVTVGCQRQPQVTKYTVPSEPLETVPPATSAAPVTPPPGMTAPSGPQRMLASMIHRGEMVWFFKLLGPPEAVAKQAGAFRSFIESVRFADAAGTPQWTLPEGWHQQAATGMRFATITIDAPGTPLEMTVIPLKPTAGAFRDYVLANVDRWRQQLGLPPTSMEKLFGPGERSGELVETKLGDGGEALIVDLAGEGGSSVASGLAGSMSGPPPAMAMPPNPGAGGGAMLTYKAPEGWTPGRTDAMRRAAFAVRDGAKSAEITVIALSAAGGDLLANVNRWREQVHLSSIDRDALEKQAKDIPVGGETGKLVDLVGPPDAQPRESILGVICTHGDQAWFFKMKGDPDLVARERGRFESFVRSARFE